MRCSTLIPHARDLVSILLLAWMAASCGDAREPARVAGAETLRLQKGNACVYRQKNVYTYRRNNWFFYACGEALARRRTQPSPPGTRRVLVHIDAHSDAHPAPPAAAPESLAAGFPAVLEAYAGRLSIGAYVFPLLRYGAMDEVYWVQPRISCYQGPEEIVRFDLAEQDGRVRPVVRAGATPAPVESLTLCAYRGEPVARSQGLTCAYGFATADWELGPYTLHCLDLTQFAERVRAGDLADREVLVDLDLDYFGASGPLQGYGYLSLPRHGQMALGLLGGSLPVFYMTAEERARELREVCELIARLRPRTIGVSESPDHSHHETLPQLEAELRACLLDARPLSVPEVEARFGGARPVTLTPACARYVDLGASREPRLELEWARPPGDSLEVALFFDPIGTQDRRMADWRVPGGERRMTLPLRIAAEGIGSLLGPGWDVEVRRLRDGALLFGAEFTLDAEGELLRRAVTTVGREEPAHYLPLRPSQIIAEGRGRELIPADVNRILIAHPRTLDEQCRNLDAYRAGAGTIRGAWVVD